MNLKNVRRELNDTFKKFQRLPDWANVQSVRSDVGPREDQESQARRSRLTIGADDERTVSE